MPAPRTAGRRRSRLAARALTVAVLLPLTACGGTEETAATGGGGGDAAGSAFPVTLEHAFGSTEVQAEPERVVTWGWGSTDAAIALGVVPVAIPTQSYGGDEEGVLPWVRERLEQDGAELPELLPDQTEAPVEAIAAADPDLILAPYSGLTESEYELLSQIAPTVAYPDEPWATPWRETIEIVGEALGRDEQAADLLADIDEQVAEQAAAHPELTGLTVAAVWPAPDSFSVYKPADARVDFLLDLGMESAPSVAALGDGEGETFYYTLSPERLGELSSDVLVAYADTEAAMEEFLSGPQGQLMEQVRTGAVAQVVGQQLIAAVSPPTALSLTWGLDEYVAELSAAAQAAGGA
ncbi:iron-siderophore ABC transporter substrate-binding protein [Blastococcus sp. MG754426]|uniref:iron-siderophore ABC transporter substrate-binding protein n=1 Tax=unclassified Blastococcus TaxID=2619396 RepID=UPI001EEFC9AB|nr:MULTISPECIES: iron-siderophore ABC transporter substrate-binding protein [unclassified Blastococcus]MCF6509856.1 iron-siderophore ABC transporter substrate-binding protein [Blastococcus sp. MG754426]MCF6514276.1 iron-siderophore ABC transporter substrate-binding protein [Blastococcus sp. MG754427]MCF6737409.1 iron-siderophore ABC transporter substrate-binding protein [Blastococcus sp. KM273129]